MTWMVWLGFAAFAEDRSDWVEGRWHVVTETIDHNAPLVLALDNREFVSPAWQVEATVDCRPFLVGELLGLECHVEAASVRLVTYDKWQRPRDRQRVQTILDRVQARLEAKSFRIRSPDPGRVVRVKRQADPYGLALELFDDVLNAFGLGPPPGGFVPGKRWQTGPEPLLDIPIDVAAAQRDAVVVHQSHLDEPWLMIETTADVERSVVAGHRGHYAYRRLGWRVADPPAPQPKARRDELRLWVSGREPTGARKGGLSLRATARLDAESHQLVERSWTIEGRGATTGWRAGSIRRLDEGETVTLGTTQQVADPNVPLNTLAPWLAIGERKP